MKKTFEIVTNIKSTTSQCQQHIWSYNIQFESKIFEQMKTVSL